MHIKEKTVIIFSAVILFITCVFSLGYHHLDEHFQILEFAALKLDLTVPQNLPWEYHSKMRPSFQPAMVVWVSKSLEIIGISSPFTISFFLRLISASISLLAVWSLYRVFLKEISDLTLKKWLLIFSFLFWILVYNSVRFSSENWSGAFFVLGFSYYFLNLKKRFSEFFVLGILLGFSFLFRYQAAFLVVGFVAWLAIIKREKISSMFFSFLGILLIIAVGLLFDYWYYEEWTIAMWNYFELNLLQDKVSGFGLEPWWYYISEFSVKGIPPFSILILLSFVVVFIYLKKSAITWSIFPFLLVHFLIGHKELRFLLPLVFFIPFIMIKSLELAQNKLIPRLLFNKIFRIMMFTFIAINFGALLVISLLPADNRISIYKIIYDNYQVETKLYYKDENPYDRASGINFYKRNNLSVLQLDSLDFQKLQANKPSLIAFSKKPNKGDIKLNYKLIYKSYPDWIKIFNFNGWVERSDCWYLYELEGEP